jgi:F-type H+-transporting ATPase subunit delta
VAEHLRRLTGAREVRLSTRVDPSIIGGVIARIGDRLIDGSTRTRLIQLRRTLAGEAT